MKTKHKLIFLFTLVFFLLPSFVFAQGSGTIFSFAVISDTHDANQCSSKQGKWADMAIGIINKEKPDFVIGLGDLVAGGGDCGGGNNGIEEQLEEFKKVYLDKLNVPFVPMAGNHDFSKEPAHAKTAWDNFWNNNKDKVLSNGSFSGYPRSYTFTHKGIKFDILDYYGNYGYNKAEKQWIESNVNSGDLVFRHVNPYGVTNARFAMRSTGNIKDYEQLTELLKQKKIGALFSGHTHGFYEGICDNLHFINTGSLGVRSMEYALGIASEFQKKQAFVWVDVLSDKSIEVSFYYYNGTELVKFDKTNFPETIETKKMTRTKEGNTYYEGVAATCQKVDTPTQLVTSQKILMIGDSHSAHYYYGKYLHKLIREAGFQVELYGVGGSSSRSWMSGAKGTGKLLTSVHADEQGNITPLTDGEKYTLKDLKKSYQPDTVIISLGTNEIPQKDASFFSKFDSPLAEIAATGAKCYWIGPPKNKRPNFEDFQGTADKIKAEVEKKGCTFIDSIPLSDSSLLKDDNIHYTQPGGEQWAQKVFEQLNLTASQNTTQKVVVPMTLDEVKDLLRTPFVQIDIPGLDFSTKEEISQMATNENGDFYIHIPFLAEYLSAIYRYGIIAGGVIAIVMLMNQGFGLAIAGGNSTKISETKKKIGNLAIGFLLLVGSYLILYIINPQLVTLKSLKILYVAKEELYTGSEDTDYTGPTLTYSSGESVKNLTNLKPKGEYSCKPDEIRTVAMTYADLGACLRPKTCAFGTSFVLDMAGCKTGNIGSVNNLVKKVKELGWKEMDIRGKSQSDYANLPVGLLFRKYKTIDHVGFHAAIHVGNGRIAEASYSAVAYRNFWPTEVFKAVIAEIGSPFGRRTFHDKALLRKIDLKILIPAGICPILSQESSKGSGLCNKCNVWFPSSMDPEKGSPQKKNGQQNHYFFISPEGSHRMKDFSKLYYPPPN